MASPEKITPLLPETLPEDFGDWDSEGSPVASPGAPDEWEALGIPHSFAKSSMPLGPSVDHDGLLPPTVDKPRASSSSSPAPTLVKRERDFSDRDRETSRSSTPAPAPVNQNEWDDLEFPQFLDKPAKPLNQSVDREQWEALEAPHLIGKSPTPLGKSANPDAILPPVLQKPTASDSTSQTPIDSLQQNSPHDRQREAPPTTPPATVNNDEWEALQAPKSTGKFATSFGKPVGQDAILPTVAQKPPASGSTSQAPVAPQQQDGYNDRHRETAYAPSTADQDEWEALQAPRSGSRSATPLAKSTEPDPISPQGLTRPRVSGSGSSMPVSLKPSRSTSALLVDVSPDNAAPTSDGGYTMHEVPKVSGGLGAKLVAGVLDKPEVAPAASREPDTTLFQSFQAKDEEIEEQKTAKKKWTVIALVGVCSILLLLILGSVLLQHRTKSAAIQSVQPAPAISDTQPETTTTAPSAPLTENNPSASTQAKPAAEARPTIEANGVNPPQAQKDMMHDQLTAPLQIPQAAKKQVTETEPPPEGLGSADAEGLGGSGGSASISSGQRAPIVKPLKPVVISAGVATGLLIQKNPPIYPAIARSARISGTVILEATITTTGTIKNLYAVSGPAMLRQAAVDAVRTWRYKPYTLNNEPVEVQATINVIFNLGQ